MNICLEYILMCEKTQYLIHPALVKIKLEKAYDDKIKQTLFFSHFVLTLKAVFFAAYTKQIR